MRRARLWLVLALAVALGGGAAHQALAGRDGGREPARSATVASKVATKQKLTAAQKAARAKIIAQAEFLEENDLNCGCRHHFPAPKT